MISGTMGIGGLCVAVLLDNGIVVANSSKILVLPFGMYSHINIHTKLGQVLQEDGHEVWMLAFDKYKADIEKRGLTPLIYPLLPEADLFKKFDELMAEKPDGEGVFDKILADDYWKLSFSRMCDSVMQSAYLMATIGREKFDLVVIDGDDSHICFLMIPYVFDIPFVIFHGFQTTSWSTGVTGMPSIEPEISTLYSNKMDFWQRIGNLKSWLNQYYNMYYDLYSDHHMKNYCPAHKPKISLKELSEKAEMYLMNFEIMCLDYPRVSAPNMQYLGGSTMTAPEPLPKDLESFVADAAEGVVLLSFGSMREVHHVWKIIGKKLFDAFSRLPQRVIVQYRLDEVYEDIPSNVKLMKWIPQNDILGHSKIKLFVTHGGNNGQNEAAHHGVPMLVIPLIVDQFYNAERVHVHGYGKYVKDKTRITSEELYQMMTDIITNETYSANIKKCAAIIHSMPSAQEKYVFWINHILKFGGAHLRPPSLDMPLFKVLMLDIVAYYVVMALAAIHAAIFLLYSVTKHVLKYFKHKRD